VTINLVSKLQLAVNATIPLFKAAWVPRDIKMEKIVAMSLEIRSFPCSVVAKKDAERIF
jgi:hypothetical protein